MNIGTAKEKQRALRRVHAGMARVVKSLAKLSAHARALGPAETFLVNDLNRAATDIEATLRWSRDEKVRR